MLNKGGIMIIKKIVGILICLLFIFSGISTVASYLNNPPSTPEIDGPKTGKPGVEYDFTFISTDPDGDDVFYCVSWGCCGGGDFHTYGPYESGVEEVISHSWPEQGTYIIHAYAKDIHEAESGTVSFENTMPRGRLLPNTLFMTLLEKFPNVFPILRYILGLQ